MYIKVKVRAGAKKEVFKKLSDSNFEIAVREKAERNLANHRVIELVAAELHLPVSKVRLIAGHRSPSKVFSV